MRSPSSEFSLAHDCPFRIVTERDTTEFDLEPTIFLEEWFLPFPEATDAPGFVLTRDSPPSLMLRRCLESENNLSDT